VGAPSFGEEDVSHLLYTLRLCGGEVVLLVGVGDKIESKESDDMKAFCSLALRSF
jgi:hypothetical protein